MSPFSIFGHFAHARLVAILGLAMLVTACSGLGGPSNEERDQFLTEFLSVMSENWDLADIKALTTEEAYTIFVSDDEAATFRIFATLGKFKNLDSSTTTGWRSTVATGTTISTESIATFENGKAQVSATLTYDGDAVKLHYIYIQSPRFLELMERVAESEAL